MSRDEGKINQRLINITLDYGKNNQKKGKKVSNNYFK